MSMMLLSPPLGVIGGYIMTVLILFYSSWHVSFLVQGIMAVLSAAVLLLIP